MNNLCYLTLIGRLLVPSPPPPFFLSLVECKFVYHFYQQINMSITNINLFFFFSFAKSNNLHFNLMVTLFYHLLFLALKKSYKICQKFCNSATILKSLLKRELGFKFSPNIF